MELKDLLESFDDTIITPVNPEIFHRARRVGDGAGLIAQDGSIPEVGKLRFEYEQVPPTFTGDFIYDSHEVFFAGCARPHFGHFVTESLGRLWGLESLPADMPIVYVGARPAMAEVNAKFQKILTHLGLPNPVKLIVEPTKFKKVFTVEDCYNNYLSGYIKTPFTDWLTKNRAPAAINPDLKLYVSRSQLPNKKGRFLGEKQLESALLNEGYLIVYPEQTPIRKQIRLYQHASKLIFAESSALHFYALLGHSEQQVVTIRRRNISLPHLSQAVQTFSNARYHEIERVQDMCFRDSAKIEQFHAISTVDLKAAWQDLRRMSFVAGEELFVDERLLKEELSIYLTSG